MILMRNSQNNLVIDGVDWTVTNRRYRRKCALNFAGFLACWVGLIALLVWIGVIDTFDNSFYAGAIIGGFLGFYDGFRDGRAFGRVFQRVTESTQYIESPAESRYSKVYRAPAHD